MKIKDIITEGLYDYLTQLGQQGKQAAWANGGAEKYYADQRAKDAAAQADAQSKRDAAAAAGVEQSGLRDARTDLPDDQSQFMFPDQNDKTINIVIRKDGYFLTKLPQQFRGYKINKEPGTNLYRVTNPSIISQINQWYDEAQARKIVVTTQKVSRL